MLWVARDLFDVRGPAIGKRRPDGAPMPLSEQLVRDGILTEAQLEAVVEKMYEILEGASSEPGAPGAPTAGAAPPPAKRLRSWTEILTGPGVPAGDRVPAPPRPTSPAGNDPAAPEGPPGLPPGLVVVGPRPGTRRLVPPGGAPAAGADGADWLGKLASADTGGVVHSGSAHAPAASGGTAPGGEAALPERIETLADAEALCARLTEVPENPEDAAWLVELIVSCKNPLAREKLQAHIMRLHRKAQD